MKIAFTKMQGLGNDFVLIEALKEDPEFSTRTIRRLCDRRFGIGADQILLLLSSEIGDARMRIFNADGGEVEMCGNGIRCFAKYLFSRGIVKKKRMAVETLAGVVYPVIRKGEVRVDMGSPILEGQDIPVDADGRVIDFPFEVGGHNFRITCVSMGNPHCVIFLENVRRFPVSDIGPLIENDSLFPNRTNVEFVQVLGKEELQMRVWERGSGETLACGTGACASLVAASLNGLTGRKALVRLDGGDLAVEWDRKTGHVFLTGGAEEIFSGKVDTKNLKRLSPKRLR